MLVGLQFLKASLFLSPLFTTLTVSSNELWPYVDFLSHFQSNTSFWVFLPMASPSLTSLLRFHLLLWPSPSRPTKFIVMWFLPLVLPLLAGSLCSIFSISMEQEPNHMFLLFKSQLKDQLLQEFFLTHLPIHQIITDPDFYHNVTLKQLNL